MDTLPTRFSKKEQSILQLIIEENLSNFTFDGIKRKTGMHQESMSRALAELEYMGLITKTNKGYHVADNPREHFAIPIPLSYNKNNQSVHLPLVQTILPDDVDLESILSSLQGKWFGRLRWFGCSKTETSMTLKWLTVDGQVQIEALFSDSSLSVECKLQSNRVSPSKRHTN